MIKYGYIPGITIEISDFINEYTKNYSIKFYVDTYKVKIRLEQFTIEKASALLNDMYNFIKYREGTIEVVKQKDRVIGKVISYRNEKYGFKCEVIIQ